MQRSRVAVLAIVAGVTTFAFGTLGATDVGWCRVGVRAWYAESIGSSPVAHAMDAYLLDQTPAGAVVVRHNVWQLSVLQKGWAMFLDADEPCLQPAAEGPFWIHPDRLRPLAAVSGSLTWLGQEWLCAEHALMTADKIPLLRLPGWALFQASPQRDIVHLKSAVADQSVSDDYFDVETGLLLWRFDQNAGTKTIGVLSEINYDFAAGQAIAEDDGPHTSMVGAYTSAVLYGGMFQFYAEVTARYRNVFGFELTTSLSGPGAPAVLASDMIYYDADAGRVLRTPQNLSLPPLETWEAIGDHFFAWIPPSHLTRPNLAIWGSNLARAGAGGGRTTFTSATLPGGPGFQSLTFGDDGYLQDLAVNNPAAAVVVDSTGMVLDRECVFMGLEDFRASLKHTIPAGAPLIRAAVPAPGNTAKSAGASFLALGSLGAREPFPLAPVPAAALQKAGGGMTLAIAKAAFEAAAMDIQKQRAACAASLKAEYETGLNRLMAKAGGKGDAARFAKDALARLKADGDFPRTPIVDAGAVADLQKSCASRMERADRDAAASTAHLTAGYAKVLDELQRKAGDSAMFQTIEREKYRVWNTYEHGTAPKP